MAIGSKIDPESVEAIAGRLKDLREAYDLKQAAWCRKIGIEPQAWNNYETAIRKISLEQALKVCRATGVSLDWIYRATGAIALPADIAGKLKSPNK